MEEDCPGRSVALERAGFPHGDTRGIEFEMADEVCGLVDWGVDVGDSLPREMGDWIW